MTISTTPIPTAFTDCHEHDGEMYVLTMVFHTYNNLLIRVQILRFTKWKGRGSVRRF